MYYGPGAGAEPTASSVVADIVDVARTLTTDPDNRVPHLAFNAKSLSDTPILPIDQIVTAYYLRITAKDTPGVMAKVATILSDSGINIESLLQKEVDVANGQVPIIMITRQVKEQNMNVALKKIEAQNEVVGSVMRIRLEQLDG